MEKTAEKTTGKSSVLSERRKRVSRGGVQRDDGNGHDGGTAGGNGDRRENGHGAAGGRRVADIDTLNHRQLLAGLRALQRGEFDVRLPDDLPGTDGQICATFNDVVQFAASLRSEVVALRHSV